MHCCNRWIQCSCIVAIYLLLGLGGQLSQENVQAQRNSCKGLGKEYGTTVGRTCKKLTPSHPHSIQSHFNCELPKRSQQTEGKCRSRTPREWCRVDGPRDSAVRSPKRSKICVWKQPKLLCYQKRMVVLDLHNILKLLPGPTPVPFLGVTVSSNT